MLHAYGQMEHNDMINGKWGKSQTSQMQYVRQPLTWENFGQQSIRKIFGNK